MNMLVILLKLRIGFLNNINHIEFIENTQLSHKITLKTPYRIVMTNGDVYHVKGN